MMTQEHGTTLIRFITLVVALSGVSAVSFPGLAFGQGVPRINIVPSCKAAAATYVGLPQEFESCRRSEEAAREILVKQWNTFLPGDRTSCHRLTTTGTPGTYTELLTCLEMRRDARALPTAEERRKDAARPRRSRSKAIRDPAPSGSTR
jgi:hypothetical protein